MIIRAVALIAVAFTALGQTGYQAEELRRFAATIDAAMDLKVGSQVADIGSGDEPFHAIRIVKAIGPTGRLVCQDIDGTALKALAAKLKADGVQNVEFIVGVAEDPKLPVRTFDAILISNAYHHFTRPEVMLKHVREALKPDGNVVVLEAISPKVRDKSRDEQVKAHELAPENLVSELEAAGFRQAKMIVLRVDGDSTRYLVSARAK